MHNQLEVVRLPSARPVATVPPVVFLHEGLGSVSLWRDFPQRVADATSCEAVVYSRQGHGRSDPLTGPRCVRYLHDEALIVLPALIPQRWRRKMMSMGSGHPTRIICSALIAQAFDSVRYPILPKISRAESESAREELLEIRHSSLYAPRDFDISPYFEVVKPTLLNGFDYKKMQWADQAIAFEIEALSITVEAQVVATAPGKELAPI